MKYSYWILTCFILLMQLPFASGQKPANEELFNHALNTPDSVEGSYYDLASYLKGASQNDRETVEAIFYWVAINIIYFNDPGYETSYADSIAIRTLQTKKSGCEGTARLFYELCSAAGIECVVVFGIAKDYGFEKGNRSNSNHGWNAVEIGGKWELVDATWGGGGATHIDGKLVHVKELDMRYFFADPDNFVIDHFPEQRKWQLLDKPISKRTFYSDFWELKRMAKLTKYTN